MTASTPATPDPSETLGRALAKLRRDCELLDGRDFKPAEHDANDAALASLAAELAQARQALEQIATYEPHWPRSNLYEAQRIARAALAGEDVAT